MPSQQPLGTLTWRSIRENEGRAMIGHNFGGLPFECGEAGPSNFFRGHYAEGGDLVACTTGADGRTLVGRFNGNETFKSGSFEVTIISEAPRIFFGKYFEDDGVVTDWCGVLGTKGPLTPETVDIGAPVVRALAATGRSGAIVPLRASARDNSGAAATLRPDDLPERPQSADALAPRASRRRYRHRPLARAEGAARRADALRDGRRRGRQRELSHLHHASAPLSRTRSPAS